MCLIIDACVRDRIFGEVPAAEAKVVIDWIETKGGRMAYGGTKLSRELTTSSRARRRIRTWIQAGLVHQYPNSEVDAEQARIDASHACVSNDSHVIALARISGARTLYSFDHVSGLHRDFKNRALLSDPGGSIYQHEDHRDLLIHTSSCKIALASLRSKLFPD